MSGLSSADLALWSNGAWDGQPPSTFTGVSHDSRRILPGSLFMALRGANHDGHTFVQQAGEAGASAAVVETRWQRPPGLAAYPLLRVASPHQALIAMGQGLRRKLNPTLVGVTGSAGKSTAKEMTAQLLNRHFRTAWTQGNWNNDIGLPLSLLGMEPDITHGVFEVGTNHPGEIESLCRILEPTLAMVTNVAAVHIGNFGSVEAITHEKGALLRALPANGHAFLNSDLACFEQLKSYCPCPITTVVTSTQGDYHVDRVEPDGTAIAHERASGLRLRFRLPVPGQHNLANAMMALAVARHLGIDGDSLIAGLETFKPMPMRWQVQQHEGVTFINDAYNANPLSMRAAIRTALQQPASRHWLVLGGMLEMGEHEAGEHAALGEFIGSEAKPHRLVVIGHLGKRIADAAMSAGLPATAIDPCPDNATAARRLKDGLADGDLVLFKASRSFKLESIVHTLTGTGVAH